MKQIIKTIAIVVSLINTFTLTSCSKSNDDDTNTVTENHFVFDNEVFETSNGYYTIDENIATIVLYTNDLDYNIINGNASNQSVNGSLILFYGVDTDEQGNLIEGTYNISTENALALINVNDWGSEDGVEGKKFVCTSGTVSVSKNNNKNSIDYNFQFQENKSAIGKFTNDLELK